jgi:hypothetical protein
VTSWATSNFKFSMRSRAGASELESEWHAVCRVSTRMKEVLHYLFGIATFV